MKPFLVQYTIRSKQNYIFKTNRLKEVTGASVLIANAFERLHACAGKIGLVVQRADPAVPFSLEAALKAFEEGTLQVAELYQGGGNDTLLVNSEDTFRRLNEAYTYELMVEVPGMIPLCVGVPMCEERDYRKDYENLSAVSSLQKSVMISGQPHDGLPFSMIDSNTRQPFQPDKPRIGAKEHYTGESLAKQKQYLISEWQDESASELDELLGEKDSMLAIVHADGNNMGKKLREKLGDEKDYDTCVRILREFSREIDRVFVEEGSAAVEEEKKQILQEIGSEADKSKFVEVRSMISDGDDYTFICNAKWALKLTTAYLRRVSQYEGYSACAGICLFHRHYPFVRAYSLAEQACENAKKKVHIGNGLDQCWLDFYYLHGGVPDDLEETRLEHGTYNCMFRPWRCDDTDDPASVEKLINLSRIMISSSGEQEKTTRTNLKTLGSAMETSRHEAEGELRRIFFRVPELKERLSELFPDGEDQLKAIYDLSETYDLWFGAEGVKKDG